MLAYTSPTNFAWHSYKISNVMQYRFIINDLRFGRIQRSLRSVLFSLKNNFLCAVNLVLFVTLYIAHSLRCENRLASTVSPSSIVLIRESNVVNVIHLFYKRKLMLFCWRMHLIYNQINPNKDFCKNMY